MLGDLLVAEPLGLQRQRPQLLRLEPLQCLGGTRHAVEGEHSLLRVGQLRRLLSVEVDVLAGHLALARCAQAHRFVLDDRVHPFGHAIGVQSMGVAQEDLERALVCILGVVEAQAVATGNAEQRVGVVA